MNHREVDLSDLIKGWATVIGRVGPVLPLAAIIRTNNVGTEYIWGLDLSKGEFLNSGAYLPKEVQAAVITRMLEAQAEEFRKNTSSLGESDSSAT